MTLSAYFMSKSVFDQQAVACLPLHYLGFFVILG